MSLVTLTLNLWPGSGEFGALSCHFLPMVQLYTIVVSTLTHLAMALDRYHLVMHDSSRRYHSKLFYISVILGLLDVRVGFDSAG